MPTNWHFEGLITPATLGIWGLIAAIIIWWIRGAPARMQSQTERDASLRQSLLKRIDDLEADLAAERKKCEDELRKLRQHIDGIMRKFVQYQIAIARMLPNAEKPVSDAILKMLTDLEETTSCPPPAVVEREEDDDVKR